MAGRLALAPGFVSARRGSETNGVGASGSASSSRTSRPLTNANILETPARRARHFPLWQRELHRRGLVIRLPKGLGDVTSVLEVGSPCKTLCGPGRTGWDIAWMTVAD